MCAVIVVHVTLFLCSSEHCVYIIYPACDFLSLGKHVT